MSFLTGAKTQLMLSLLTAEASLGAGVVMNASNAHQLRGFEVDYPWDDRVENDKDDITGSEYPTTQEIITKACDMNIKEGKAKPNTLAGLGNLVLGSRATVKDGAFDAYQHYLTPLASGSPLPSIQGDILKGEVQEYMAGLVGNRLAISGEAGGFISMEADLMGSGHRGDSAAAFVAVVDESWLKAPDTLAWLALDGDISLTMPPAGQGTDDIATASPVAIYSRLQSFNFEWNNNNERDYGHGSETAQDIDNVAREPSLSMVLTFVDETERDYFINQTALAVEIDCAGALIDASGAYKYGFQLQIPLCKVNKRPDTTGGPTDKLTVPLEFTIMDDLVNPVVGLTVYTAIPAYLA